MLGKGEMLEDVDWLAEGQGKFFQIFACLNWSSIYRIISLHFSHKKEFAGKKIVLGNPELQKEVGYPPAGR